MNSFLASDKTNLVEYSFPLWCRVQATWVEKRKRKRKGLENKSISSGAMNWYAGYIVRRLPSGCYGILYDDGDEALEVPERTLLS